jgi:hypothetical protein
VEIRVGGRRWIVNVSPSNLPDEREVPSWEVSFSGPDGPSDRVEMRWIPRPERLTENMARKLFELAGERLWQDTRTGVIYRIQLVDEGEPGDDADPTGGRMCVRFRTGTGTATVRYDLSRPLGMATDVELQALADEAFGKIRAKRA